MSRIFLFFAILLAAIFSQESFAGKANWKIVPNKEVCMVTNVHFARAQIPVEKDGKTYYGCCENCKTTISKDAGSRTAIDPLTKKSVDKAKAVVAANESGEVMYFENQNNFKRYLTIANVSGK